jgi:acetaldehyde dehydrogenase
MTKRGRKTRVAILGSGNIGTDLMIKIERLSDVLQMASMVGIDESSPGLAKARALGIATTANGIEGLTGLQEFGDVEIVFDATSAGAHAHHHAVLTSQGKRLIDLTPAAIGPYTVPVVNMDAHLDESNINMVTCGGQATIPIVAAISGVVPVQYGEIIASISSRSAGPGTRANIDEFTQTTARGLEIVGGARKGKAIIILNPGEPPLIMRDTVYCLSDDADPEAICRAVGEMVARVQAYVPGYRLKQQVQFERIGDNNQVHIPGFGDFSGLRTSVFIEVEGAGHFLPPYAGNLDIMTSAALATAERLAISLRQGR